MTRPSRATSRLPLAVLSLILPQLLLTALAEPDVQARPVNLEATARDPRVVVAPRTGDRNGNRVDDRLEAAYRRDRTAGLQSRHSAPAADLILCLDHAPTAADLAHYRRMGATRLESWSDLVYAIRARFPAAQLPPHALARMGQQPGVVWVTENSVMRAQSFVATRQTGARRAWSGGNEGNPDQAIAILDTGVDGTHPDLASRIVAWADFVGVDSEVVGDEYPTPTDRRGHGTFVAGLAAGNGSSAGIVAGVGPLNLTMAVRPAPASFQQVFPIDTRAAAGPTPLTARLYWEPVLPGSFNWLQLWGSEESRLGLMGTHWTASTATQPLTLTVPEVPAGLVSSAFRVEARTGIDTANAFGWLQVSTPMSAVGDGRPLMSGVAPGCKIVGVKVLDDGGNAPFSAIMNALSWVNAQRRMLNIVCVNASFAGGFINVLEETLVNRLVENGVVWVSACGNERDAGRVGVFSPGSAAKGIAVGAVNDRDQVTSYSNFGRDKQRKPDLVAPGGSSRARPLSSIDSNAGDTAGSARVADQFPDDYSSSQGTSFASPLVAGGVMLLAQAIGRWEHTEDQARIVKMLLLMTASETGGPAENRPPHPMLNRGDRDPSEGFGRVNLDAAIEAWTRAFAPVSSATETLGPGPLEKKVWARHVDLSAGTAYSFALHPPLRADYDLYLYSGTPASIKDNAGVLLSDGEPQIVASGTRAASGATEAVEFTPSTSGRYYLVVKYVGGSGGAFRVTGSTEADFLLSAAPASQLLEVPGEAVAYTVSVAGRGGFNAPVSLFLATPLPPGTTARFAPESVRPGEVSVLTIETSATTPRMNFAFRIAGTAGAATRETAAQLETGAIWPRLRHDSRGTGRSPFRGPQEVRRRIPTYLVSDGIASAPAIGTDGTVYIGTRMNIGSPGKFAAYTGSDGTLIWTYQTVRGANIDSSPAIGADGTIYFGDDGGRLYALFPNGAEKWQLPLGSAPVRSGPVLAPDGTVYVTAAGNLYAVSREGTLKWRFTSGGNQNSSPTLARDGTIYFGAGGSAVGGLYAVRDTGTAAERKWVFATAGAVLSSPLVAANGRIYVGSDGDNRGGRFYVIEDRGATALKVAEVVTEGAVQSSPAQAADGSLYVGCNDGRLYAFTPEGGLKWRFSTGGPIVASPAVDADGTIYVGSRDRFAYAIRDQGSDSVQLWRESVGEVIASPAIGPEGTLYVAGQPGFLRILRDSAGTLSQYSLFLTITGRGRGLVGESLTGAVSVSARNSPVTAARLQVASALPPGVTVSFAPADVSLARGFADAALTIATSSETPAGAFSFKIRLADGGTTLASTDVTLELADYGVRGQPAVQRVTAGGAAAFSVAVLSNPELVFASSPSFRGKPVELTAAVVSGPSTGAPPALTLDHGAVVVPGFATLTATTSPATTPGIYLLEARAAAGAIHRTAILRLEVAGFAVSATPTAAAVTRGGSTTLAVNVRGVAGFSQIVTLSPTAPLPAGVTMTFDPPAVGGSGLSTLTVATSAETPLGIHRLTLAGSSEAIAMPVTILLTVNQAP
jgi:outer membrane protein assembly factor BamB/subtilisin family serine protease